MTALSERDVQPNAAAPAKPSLERRSQSEPGVAAYFLSGWHGPRVDALRSAEKALLAQAGAAQEFRCGSDQSQVGNVDESDNHLAAAKASVAIQGCCRAQVRTSVAWARVCFSSCKVCSIADLASAAWSAR